MTDALRGVLLVLDRAGQGGMQSVVGLLTEVLSSAGVEVHVAVGGDDDLPEILTTALDVHPDAHLHRLVDPRGIRGRAHATAQLARLIRTLKPDVVHGHGLRTSWPLVVAGQRRPRRVLVTCHGLPPGDLSRSARLVRPTGVTVGAVAPGLRDELAAHHLRTVLLENAVTPAPPAADRDAFMASLGLDPSMPLVVSPARLSPQKDPITLVRAVATTDAALVLVGDGPLRGQVEHEIEARQLAGRVVVTGWRDDARAVLGAADVMAMSSRWEGQALVMLEAAAAGVPIVATRAPGIDGWLRDGVDALLEPVGDHLALGRAIERAIHDASIRHALLAGGAVLAKRHDTNALLEAHLRVYRTLS